jgi:hypothetical protein
MRSFVGLVAGEMLLSCGAMTDPLVGVFDGGRSDASVADGSPADADADADTGPDTGPTSCNGDADYDAALCTAPLDDQLIADPPVITVAAGSASIAQFKAIGPWASDPNMWISFESATIALQGWPSVQPNQPPTGFLIEVPASASDTEGTFTALGRDGNIERSATLVVHVTGCVPWDAATACNGFNCGYEGDHCGGLVNCGSCPSSAPYCFLGYCQATQPMYCPDGDGITPGLGCEPCTKTMTCRLYCSDGRCVGLQDVCFCAPLTFPPCPAAAPVDGSECYNPGQSCLYYGTCQDSTTCRCEPSGQWTCPPLPPCQ